MEQAITANEPILAGIKKSEGETPAIAMLEILISDFVKFFSVGKGMNSAQIIETSKLFYSEFYFLKISDIKLFFTQMRTGYYGTIYDRIDGNVIFTHLRNYCEARINCAETLSIEKHKQLMALDGEQTYIISVGKEFIARDGNEFVLVDKRENATQYVFSDAISTKKFLIKNYTNEFEPKIERPLKPVQSLIEYIKENKPEWVPNEIRDDKVKELKAKRKLIEDNAELSAFQKRNAINLLYGFKQMTLEEFREEQDALKNKPS